MITKFTENAFLMHAVRATAMAAASASNHAGRGDKNFADGLAVEQMRKVLGNIDSSGVVVIGEGEADEAPMLYFGEKLGKYSGATPEGEHVFEVAVDPLDGTTLCAKNMDGAVAVLALAPRGCVLHAPDMYMHKIAVGGKNLPKDLINLDDSIAQNIKNIAKAKQKQISELAFVCLDRERHKEIIAKIRETGAMVNLIPDGDVMGVLSICNPFNRADGYFGLGGAPEGVITAAMLKSVGGLIHGRLAYDDEAQKQKAIKMLAKSGITDPNKQLTQDDMIKGDEFVFSSTAVTASSMLDGIKKIGDNLYQTHTIAGSGESGYLFIKQEVSL